MTRGKSPAAITVDSMGTVLKGGAHLFVSYESALKQSQYVSSSPDVVAFTVRGGETRYAAKGDSWIDHEGLRGTHLYGRNGRLLERVESGRDEGARDERQQQSAAAARLRRAMGGKRS